MSFDPVQYVEKFTELQQRARGDWWGRCPLPDHDDSTPSFHMDGSGTFYCFGCNVGGRFPSLISRVKQVPYSEARAYLLAKGWEPPPDKPARTTSADIHLRGLEREAAYWTAQLKQTAAELAQLNEQSEEAFEWDRYAAVTKAHERAERELELLDARIIRTSVEQKDLTFESESIT